MAARLLIQAAMLAARPVYGGIGAIHVMHRIVPNAPGPRIDNQALELTPEDLDAIIGWMKERSYEFIRLDQLAERLARPSRNKFVCFTFDDGYRDNLVHALPVFEKHDVPFAVNITTGFVDGTDFVWWYALEELLVTKEGIAFEVGGKTHEFVLGLLEERVATFETIAGLIRDACDLGAHENILAAVFEAAAFDPYQKHGRELILGWEELTAFAAHPLVTIGAHGVHHLTSCKLSETDLREEFAGSRRILEERLGRPVLHLAYPFGGRQAVGPREFNCARECGFETAFTTRSGNLFPAHAGALDRLPRLCLSGNYKAIPRLERLESGLVSARANRWKRVVTE
jgi:peptidoglycan/xylan/chitin deacetylase (PgdA/CDA1 family)